MSEAKKTSLRIPEDVLAEAKTVADAEGVKQAQILNRWLRQKAFGGGVIQVSPSPEVPAQFWDHARLTEELSGTALGLDDLRMVKGKLSAETLDKIMESRNGTAAKALAKIPKNSSGAARGRVFYGHPEAMTARSILGDEEDGALVGAAGSPVEAPSCSECFKYLTTIKGKLVCATPGCTLEGLVR